MAFTIVTAGDKARKLADVHFPGLPYGRRGKVGNVAWASTRPAGPRAAVALVYHAERTHLRAGALADRLCRKYGFLRHAGSSVDLRVNGTDTTVEFKEGADVGVKVAGVDRDIVLEIIIHELAFDHEWLIKQAAEERRRDEEASRAHRSLRVPLYAERDRAVREAVERVLAARGEPPIRSVAPPPSVPAPPAPEKPTTRTRVIPLDPRRDPEPA